MLPPDVSTWTPCGTLAKSISMLPPPELAVTVAALRPVASMLPPLVVAENACELTVAALMSPPPEEAVSVADVMAFAWMLPPLVLSLSGPAVWSAAMLPPPLERMTGPVVPETEALPPSVFAVTGSAAGIANRRVELAVAERDRALVGDRGAAACGPLGELGADEAVAGGAGKRRLAGRGLPDRHLAAGHGHVQRLGRWPGRCS